MEKRSLSKFPFADETTLDKNFQVSWTVSKDGSFPTEINIKLDQGGDLTIKDFQKVNLLRVN